MAFSDCLSSAMQQGQISREEAQRAQDNYDAQFKASGNAGKAKSVVIETLRRDAQETRRRRLLAVQANDKLLSDLNSYRNSKGQKDIFWAVQNIFEGDGYSGFQSLKYMADARVREASSEMSDLLRNFARTFGTGMRKNASDLGELVKAAFGKSNNPKMNGLYKAFEQVSEKLRGRFNELGGDIGHLKNWGLPMIWDGGAVMRAGKNVADSKANFVADMMPRLDWDKMQRIVIRDPTLIDHGLLTIPDRKAFLEHAYESIVTNGGIDREAQYGLGQAKGALADQRGDHRFFTFKTPEDWNAINTKYGTGDAFSTIDRHIHGMAKDIAMMERLGPNPKATVEYLKQLTKQEADRHKVGKDSLWNPDKKATSVANRLETLNATIDGYYDQLTGGATKENALSLSGTTLRNLAGGAKLGSAVVVHASTNPFIMSYARYLRGVPIMEGLSQFLHSFGNAAKEEAAFAGLITDDAMRTIGSRARSASAFQKVARWSEWLPDRTTHWSGLIPMVESFRRATGFGLMKETANNLKMNWGDLEPRFKQLMEGSGFTEQDWKIMQQADLYKSGAIEKGTDYLRWKEIRDAGVKKADAINKILGTATPFESTTIPELGPAPMGQPLQGDALKKKGGISFSTTQEQLEELAAKHTLDMQDAANAREATEKAAAAQRAAQAAHDVALKYLAMLSQETERAVPTHSWRAQQMLPGRGLKGGTFFGEVRRNMFQFKGFMGSFMVGQLVALAREGGVTSAKGAGYAASVAATLALGGMMTLQLKNLSTGKDPRSMDPTTKDGLKSWGHAILTSGSLGILGDFLASDVSSFGHGLGNTMLGPVGGDIDDLRQFLVSAYTKEEEGKDVGLGHAFTNILRNNTPFLSTSWALRAAYNRLVIDTLQRLIDPKATQSWLRQQATVRKDTNQGYFWRPGQNAPDRLPGATEGR